MLPYSIWLALAKLSMFIVYIYLTLPLATIQVIAMPMHTSHKLKMQENIASMSLTIFVGDFQARM